MTLDHEDAEYFAQWAWCTSARGEPKTSRLVAGKWKDTYLHRAIAERMGLSLKGTEVIWVNGDRFDCRRQNIQTRLRGQHNELRPYWVEPFSGTALFSLSDGTYAVCDLEDAAYLGQWNWTCNHGYADRVQTIDGRSVRFPMAHEVIRRMSLERGELQVDHINLCTQ